MILLLPPIVFKIVAPVVCWSRPRWVQVALVWTEFSPRLWVWQ